MLREPRMALLAVQSMGTICIQQGKVDLQAGPFYVCCSHLHDMQHLFGPFC